MNRLFAGVVLAVLSLVATLLFVLPTPSKQAEASAVITTGSGTSLIVENVYVTDSSGQRTTGSLLMDEGVIRAMGENLAAPENATVIDGTGLTAIPGLIDSHTHSYGTALEDALRYGVTTNIDMFSPAELLPEARRQREAVEPVSGADLFSAGTLATVKGGHGSQFGIPIATLSEPSEAAAWVRARKDEGSDFIKLVYMPYQARIPSLDRATAKAVIEAAHAENLLALAHISTQKAALDMLTDGIDGLVHVFADEPVSDEFVALAKSRELFVIPTLAIIASVAQEKNPDAKLEEVQVWLSDMQKQTLETKFPMEIPGFEFELALENVRKLHEASVRIVAGSDAPNPGTAHGYSLHHELKLLVDAGLTPAEAVRAATELPASIFGLSERGRLETGRRADVLLVQGNPYQSVRSSRQIKHVIKNGHVVPRVKSESEAAPALSTGTLGSFDKDLSGPDGWSWIATDDGFMGGNSTAEVSRVEREDGRYALAVKAEVKPGFAYPWAGASLGNADRKAATDVSAFSQVVFDVKGTPGTYRFMMFSGMGAGAPPTLEFEVTEDWQTVSLPIGKFSGFKPEAFTMFSIVGGTSVKAIEYAIDEVRFE